MWGQAMLADVKKDQPLTIDQIDSPYAYDDELKQGINQRGV